MNLSQYLLALSEHKKIIIVEGLPEFTMQVIRIGTNVNQVAFVANVYKCVSVEQITQLRNDLEEVKTLIKKLIAIIKNSKDRVKV